MSATGRKPSTRPELIWNLGSGPHFIDSNATLNSLAAFAVKCAESLRRFLFMPSIQKLPPTMTEHALRAPIFAEGSASPLASADAHLARRPAVYRQGALILYRYDGIGGDYFRCAGGLRCAFRKRLCAGTSRHSLFSNVLAGLSRRIK